MDSLHLPSTSKYVASFPLSLNTLLAHNKQSAGSHSHSHTHFTSLRHKRKCVQQLHCLFLASTKALTIATTRCCLLYLTPIQSKTIFPRQIPSQIKPNSELVARSNNAVFHAYALGYVFVRTVVQVFVHEYHMPNRRKIVNAVIL
jgi:hypothetical protein